MSFERDEAMFRERDARTSGYRDGADSVSRSIKRNLVAALGVEVDTVTGLLSRNLVAHETALVAVASVIERRLLEVERRTRMYTSEDPFTVAEIIWEEQTDVEESVKDDQDGVSWYDPTKYQFEVQDNGQLVAKSPRYAAPFKYTNVDSDWVAERFNLFGLDRSNEFAESVAGQLISQAHIEQGANNG